MSCVCASVRACVEGDGRGGVGGGRTQKGPKHKGIPSVIKNKGTYLKTKKGQTEKSDPSKIRFFLLQETYYNNLKQKILKDCFSYVKRY